MTVSKAVSWVFDWVALMAILTLVSTVTDDRWVIYGSMAIMLVFGWKQYFEGLFKRPVDVMKTHTWTVLK